MRIDVFHRVVPTTDRLTVNYDSGGATVVTLTEAVYETLAALCAHIQTRLQTVHASFTCTESSGTVTIAATDNFTVTWTRPALRQWLGFHQGSLSGANTYSGEAVCEGTFEASLPWKDDQIGLRWSRKAWRGQRTIGGSVKLGSVHRWRVTAVYSHSEADQFNTMYGYMLKGLGFSWFRDTLNSTPWSYANFDGVLRCQLTEPKQSIGWVAPRQLMVLAETRINATVLP